MPSHSNLQDKAKALMAQQLWVEAIPNLEEDMKVNPSNPWMLMYLSCCYYELGEYEKALNFSQQASSILPRDSTPVGLQADCYCAMGDYPRAEARYRFAIELDSENHLAKKNWRWFQQVMDEMRRQTGVIVLKLSAPFDS